MELVSLIEGGVSELRIKMHFGLLVGGGRLIKLTLEKGHLADSILHINNK